MAKTPKATVKQSTLSSNPIKLSLSVAIPAWLSCLTLIAFIYMFWLPQTQTAMRNNTAQLIADQQQAATVTAIKTINSQLRHATLQMDASTLTDIEATEARYLPLFPHAKSFHLFALGRLGVAGIAQDNAKIRNNIEKDLLRKIHNGDDSPAEIYKHDKQWLISIASPISENNKIVGAALLTIESSLLKSLVQQYDPNNGQVAIVLNANNEAIVLSHGDEGETHHLSAPSDLVTWQTRYSLSSSMSNIYNPDMTLIAAFILLIALIVPALAFIFNIRYGKEVKSNLERLNHYIKAWNNGVADKPELSITEFELSAVGVAQLGKQLREARQQQSKPSQSSNKKAADTEALDLGSVLDLDIEPEDSLELDLDDGTTLELDEPEQIAGLDLDTLVAPDVNPSIFRAYDIRGHADTDLNDIVCENIARAFASIALEAGQLSLVVACDGRLSSPRIKAAVIKGINASGCNVIDIGLVPTPLMYFACHKLATQSGIMITGSHNPTDDNGLKFVLDNQAYFGEQLQDIRRKIESQSFRDGHGNVEQQDLSDMYIDEILSDVAIAQPLKVVVDCGNGAAGAIAPRLLEELGCEIIPLYCDIDGNFPNHHPDPANISNLKDLIQAVKAEGADLGVAFDGDGDRLGIIDNEGKIILPDRLLMLLAQDVVSRNPGTDVVYDVKCTKHLSKLIANFGGRPIMWKTGHSFIKAKMLETGALLGGELTGHIFFKERWYGFDDGAYSAARLIEILSTSDQSLSEQLKELPSSINTPELKVECAETEKFAIIDALKTSGDFDGARINDIDGLRLEFQDGWSLIRASNTTAALTLRFEADSEDAMTRIKDIVRSQLQKNSSNLTLNF